MDSDTDVCQTEQPQISYSVDFTAEQSSVMGSPILLGREGSRHEQRYPLFSRKGPYTLNMKLETHFSCSHAP